MKHTASFGQDVNSANASFNVETVKGEMELLDAALARDGGSKSVYIQTWPGLYFHPQEYPPGGEPTPTNNEEWREALRRHFSFAFAYYLSVAEVNAYWMYSGIWYDADQGYLPCNDDPSSCPAPQEWYPDLLKPLGAPLGKRTEVSPYVFEREFEHAKVHLDLNRPNASIVTFH
jgi:hypothetical protein